MSEALRHIINHEFDHLDTEGYIWVNSPKYENPAGKPLHAVPNGGNKSLCGLRRSKWSYDFFNVEQCKRCKRSYDRLKAKQ